MDLILQGEPLDSYLQHFRNAGFTDADYILSEDKDEWEAMLDVVHQDLVGSGSQLKAGHRMMIMSRLRKAKIAKENEANESMQRHQMQLHAQQPFQPGAMGGTQQQMPIGAMSDTGTATSTTFYDGFAVCMRIPRPWQLAIVAATLTFSLLVLAFYNAANTKGSADIEGGWAFVKAVYVMGFVLSGAMCLLCMLSSMGGEQNAAPLQGPACLSCVCLDELSCPCSCMDGCACPDCDLPSCLLPGCPDFEPCFRKAYKIVCCQCSITIE